MPITTMTLTLEQAMELERITAECGCGRPGSRSAADPGPKTVEEFLEHAARHLAEALGSHED